MKSKKIFLATLILLSLSQNTYTEQKTVLVAGGAGFLGSHLCERLLSLGHKVIALDNLQTSEISNITPFMQPEFKNSSNFRFIKHDIIKSITPRILNQAGFSPTNINPENSNPEALKIDWIFNLACPASPELYQQDPVHTMKTNVYGAANLLKLAKKHNARIMQFSTSEVYGDPLEHPQKEKYRGNVDPTGPRSCYDEGKRAAETLFFDYNRKYDTDIKVIRIFNTYGPRMNKYDGRVVSNFIHAALEGKDLEIYGDGLQTRSFCFVSDLIDGIMATMESPKGVTGPINLGNPNELTILELAQNIIKITNSKSQIIFKPLPKDDPKKRRPDISLAKKLLNWEPRVSLQQGLEKYISYIVNSNNQPSAILTQENIINVNNS